MKILVLGASGQTGLELVKQALDRGHHVTAVVRGTHALNEHQNLNIVVGDVFSEHDLAAISNGHDAVLSTLGNNNTKLKIIERSHAAIIQAMQNNGIKRIITELSFGGSENIRMSWLTRKLVDFGIGKVLVDQLKGVKHLQQTDLDWTVVYATVLTNGNLTKRYQVIDDTRNVSLRDKISRADVAHFMLGVLETNSYIRELPIVSGS